MNGHRDLRLVAAVAVACAVLSLIVPLGAVRVIFAAPLTLFLPGYAIVAAVAGRRPFGWLRLVPLTFGISLAALALGSIFLNYAPGGIHGASWALLLLAIVLGGCRIAASRRKPAPRRRRPLTVPRVTPGATLLWAGCLAATAAALVLAQTTLEADRAFGYTSLWMTPADQSGGVARIGVSSEQQETTVYRLEVRLGNRRAVRSFSLAPGDSRVVELDPGPSEQATRVEATLFKRGRPDDPYRHVFGWLPPGEGAPS